MKIGPKNMCGVYQGLVQLQSFRFFWQETSLIFTTLIFWSVLNKTDRGLNTKVAFLSFQGLSPQSFHQWTEASFLFTFPPSRSSVTMAITLTCCSQTICQKSCVVLGSGPYNKSNVIMICYPCDQLIGFRNPLPEFFSLAPQVSFIQNNITVYSWPKFHFEL